MWKLTVVQKRASEHSDYFFDEKVSFISDSIQDICVIIAHLTECDNEHETTYKIEKVGENDGIQEIKG